MSTFSLNNIWLVRAQVVEPHHSFSCRMSIVFSQEQHDQHLRDACAQVRNLHAEQTPSRVPSLEKLLTPKPFVAVDRFSLKTDFDMDHLDPSSNFTQTKVSERE